MGSWHVEQRLSTPWGEVAWDALGEGPPLVLIHGTPFSSYVWHRIAPWLARRRRVYWFDLVGYGASEKRPGQDVSLGVQNQVFGALLDHWEITAPDVVAHDFGGTTALRAHLLDGRDYRTLTLIDPVAITPSGAAVAGSPFVQHARDNEDAFAGVPDYLQDVIAAAYLRTAVHREMPAAELEPYVAPWRGAAGKPALYRQIAQMHRRYTDEIEPHLGEVRCPVQLLWGEQDAWIPLDVGRELHRRLGKGAFIPVPNAGHLVQEDAPEAVIAALDGFLAPRAEAA